MVKYYFQINNEMEIIRPTDYAISTESWTHTNVSEDINVTSWSYVTSWSNSKFNIDKIYLKLNLLQIEKIASKSTLELLDYFIKHIKNVN